MITCPLTRDQSRIRANIEACKQTRNFVLRMPITSLVNLSALKTVQADEFSEVTLTEQHGSTEQHQSNSTSIRRYCLMKHYTVAIKQQACNKEKNAPRRLETITTATNPTVNFGQVLRIIALTTPMMICCRRWSKMVIPTLTSICRIEIVFV